MVEAVEWIEDDEDEAEMVRKEDVVVVVVVVMVRVEPSADCWVDVELADETSGAPFAVEIEILEESCPPSFSTWSSLLKASTTVVVTGPSKTAPTAGLKKASKKSSHCSGVTSFTTI